MTLLWCRSMLPDMRKRFFFHLFRWGQLESSWREKPWRWADPTPETAHHASTGCTIPSRGKHSCIINNTLFRSKEWRDSLGPSLVGTYLGCSVWISAGPRQPRMAGQAPVCMGFPQEECWFGPSWGAMVPSTSTPAPSCHSAPLIASGNRWMCAGLQHPGWHLEPYEFCLALTTDETITRELILV